MCDVCTREDDGHATVALRGKPDMAVAADVTGSEPQIIVGPPAPQFTDARSRRDDRSHRKRPSRVADSCRGGVPRCRRACTRSRPATPGLVTRQVEAPPGPVT